MSFAGLASCGLVWLAIYDNHGLAGLGTVIVNELRAYRSRFASLYYQIKQNRLV